VSSFFFSFFLPLHERSLRSFLLLLSIVMMSIQPHTHIFLCLFCYNRRYVTSRISSSLGTIWRPDCSPFLFFLCLMAHIHDLHHLIRKKAPFFFPNLLFNATHTRTHTGNKVPCIFASFQKTSRPLCSPSLMPSFGIRLLKGKKKKKKALGYNFLLFFCLFFSFIVTVNRLECCNVSRYD